jgi:soluble lytic murein transglycosylase
MPILLRRLLTAVAATLSLAHTGSALAQSDADVLAARAAYDKGDRAKLAAIAPRLSNHVLAPDVAYWQLRLGMEDASPEAIRSFLDKYPNTPFADRLRTEWLKYLGRRALWARFGADYAAPASDDVELACYNVLFKWKRDGDAALAEALPLWFTGSSTPDACDPAFAALIAKGTITTEYRRARFRLASEAGNVKLAQAIGSDLPHKDRIADSEFNAVNRDPLGALTKGNFAWSAASGRALALFALARAARSDAGAARAAWVKSRDRLPDADRRYGNARLAYHAARQLHPLANDWYREASDAPMTPEAQAWRVRAALRALSWDDVMTAIDAMALPQRDDAAWRYWRARALIAKGKRDEGRAILASLANETSFYGMLAFESQGQRFLVPVSHPLEPQPAALAAFAGRADVKRVVKLVELDMRPEAVREWAYIVRGLPDESLLVAADHARRVGLYDRAINAADRTQTRHDYSLRYLAPYRDDFAAAAKANDIDIAMLYGIARQESRFMPDIVSSAGAVGLMQLMPGTARWVAKQLARTDYQPAQIGNTDLNTHFGAFYFKYWLERLDKAPALAAAAYNAGPGRAQAWRPPAPMEGAIWVETIPFNETRDYVKKVLANAMIYNQSLGGASTSLTALLGTVAPRSAANVSTAAAQ